MFSNKQIIYVNSNNRLTGTHTNFSIRLPINPNAKFKNVVCLDAAIPKSYYIIPDSARTFTVTEYGTTYPITLSAGNFTRKSLALEIQSKLNVTRAGYTYSVTYPVINTEADNGKYTFTVSGNLDQPTFTFPAGRLAGVLGFEPSTSYIFSADVLETPNVCNLSVESTLLLRSDIIQNFSDNIVQPINSTADPSYSYISFKNQCPEYYAGRFNGENDNVYDFSVTDENGEVLDTNGLNITFTLLLF